MSLWVYEQDLAERMRSARENDLYLPGLRLPDKIRIVTDFRAALESAEVVLSATPSHVVRAVCSEMLSWLDPSMLFVSATKGLENNTLLRMSEVIREVVSARFAPRVAALSGPTFAPEVARGEPTALVISSTDALLAETIQLAFSSPTFRVYTNQDPVGVEMGAALKNVIAIGAGVCRGLGLGSNIIAALITRGLVEITRLAVALGEQPRDTGRTGRTRRPGPHLHRRTQPQPYGGHRVRPRPQACRYPRFHAHGGGRHPNY